MKNQQALERLHRIVEQDLPTIEKNAIVPCQGGYMAFGHYHIIGENKMYRVYKNDIDRGAFTSLRSAISWCVAEKYNQYQLSKNIKNLEDRKIMISADLHVRSALAKRMKTPHIGMDAKLSTRQHQLTQIDFQLDKCINLAKYWQIRGFNNETQRTGRMPSHRTNR